MCRWLSGILPLKLLSWPGLWHCWQSALSVCFTSGCFSDNMDGSWQPSQWVNSTPSRSLACPAAKAAPVQAKQCRKDQNRRQDAALGANTGFVHRSSPLSCSRRISSAQRFGRRRWFCSLMPVNVSSRLPRPRFVQPAGRIPDNPVTATLPSRQAPWMPPATSPAAYSPATGFAGQGPPLRPFC